MQYIPSKCFCSDPFLLSYLCDLSSIFLFCLSASKLLGLKSEIKEKKSSKQNKPKFQTPHFQSFLFKDNLHTIK